MWGESLVGFSRRADDDARYGFGCLYGKKTEPFLEE